MALLIEAGQDSFGQQFTRPVLTFLDLYRPSSIVGGCVLHVKKLVASILEFAEEHILTIQRPGNGDCARPKRPFLLLLIVLTLRIYTVPVPEAIRKGSDEQTPLANRVPQLSPYTIPSFNIPQNVPVHHC